MDIVEKKFIDILKTTDEYLQDATYCNKLTEEILEIIQLFHTDTTFKGKTYPDMNKLHLNMAKYYVKAFQVYSAIQVIENVDILGFHNVTIDELILLPNVMIQPVTTMNIAYNYAIELKRVYETKKRLMNNLNRMVNNDTFLLSLEEMDELVLETKEQILVLNSYTKLLNILELYNEKKIIEDLRNYFL
jgi:hypothetical protein